MLISRTCVPSTSKGSRESNPKPSSKCSVPSTKAPNGETSADPGRPAKLTRADQLLMTLMYWREYRTQFHIAQSFGVSEPTACRTIKRVEDALLRSGKFTLPGKKALTQSDTVFEVVLVDASESPIERPKKSSGSITAARRSVTP